MYFTIIVLLHNTTKIEYTIKRKPDKVSKIDVNVFVTKKNSG